MDARLPQRLAVALLLAVGGYVHFRIWQNEYRHAPVREMFVANWVASAVVVVVLVVLSVRRWGTPRLEGMAVGAGLAISLGSLVAFALSRGPGLPTLHGTFQEHGLETTASYLFNLGSAKTILVTETLAAVLSGALLVQGGGFVPIRKG